MAIRAATESDLPALMPLLRGYCAFYGSEPPDAGLEAMARAVIRAPETEAFLLVATEAGADELVGFAVCDWKWSSLRAARIVVLDDLFVTERARGSGHADSLIEETAGIARRHGAPLVIWQTQLTNRRAQAVYDRVGGAAETLLEYKLEL